jgi:hypothetical protein
MDRFGILRISGRHQTSLPKLSENRINISGCDHNRLTEFPVAAVAREKERVPAAR